MCTMLLYQFIATSHGQVSILNNEFVYIPNNGYVGPDSFTYIITDGYVNSQPGTIYINVYDLKPVCKVTYATTHWSYSTFIKVMPNCIDLVSDFIYLKSIAT